MATVIYGKEGNVTYLQAKTEAIETMYGADTLANGSNTDLNNWDTTEQLIQNYLEGKTF